MLTKNDTHQSPITHNDFDDSTYYNSALLPKKRYADIMVDLETLDVMPRAVILSIGAVAFNLNEQESVRDFLYGVDCTARSFAQRLSLEGQIPERSVSASTFQWWLQQSDEARKALCGATTSLFAFLNDFATWVGEMRGPLTDKRCMRLWGNGAAFDNAILRDAYALYGLEHPVPFRGDMCYRTMKAMLHPGPVEVKDKELLTAHNARHDAIYQAVVLQKIWATTKAFGLMNGSA